MKTDKPPEKKYPVDICLAPLADLDKRIIDFEEATGEYGKVDEQFRVKAEKAKSPLCLAINLNTPELEKFINDNTARLIESLGTGNTPVKSGDEADRLKNAILNFAVNAAILDKGLDQVLETGKQHNPVLALEDEQQQAFLRIRASVCEKNNFLGEIGAFRHYSQYYLPDPLLIEMLERNELISKEKADQVREVLQMPSITPAMLEKLKQYELILCLGDEKAFTQVLSGQNWVRGS